MKILLTGSAGFIGFHVTKKLIEKGFQITCVDNIQAYYKRDLKFARLKELGILSPEKEIPNTKIIIRSKYSKLRFFKADLSKEKQVETIFELNRFDVICPLAAQPAKKQLLNIFLFSLTMCMKLIQIPMTSFGIILSNHPLILKKESIHLLIGLIPITLNNKKIACVA